MLPLNFLTSKSTVKPVDRISPYIARPGLFDCGDTVCICALDTSHKCYAVQGQCSDQACNTTPAVLILIKLVWTATIQIASSAVSKF